MNIKLKKFNIQIIKSQTREKEKNDAINKMKFDAQNEIELNA